MISIYARRSGDAESPFLARGTEGELQVRQGLHVDSPEMFPKVPNYARYVGRSSRDSELIGVEWKGKIEVLKGEWKELEDILGPYHRRVGRPLLDTVPDLEWRLCQKLRTLYTDMESVRREENETAVYYRRFHIDSHPNKICKTRERGSQLSKV